LKICDTTAFFEILPCLREAESSLNKQSQIFIKIYKKLVWSGPVAFDGSRSFRIPETCSIIFEIHGSGESPNAWLSFLSGIKMEQKYSFKIFAFS